MNGLMHWFKSSTKMKRWMFLILFGIILSCYGIAQILVNKEMSFADVGKIIVIFVIGFVSIVLGLIYLNKRTMEVMIESSDERMAKKDNVNMKSLIFNKTVYDKGPNIVVIGGGTGLNTVLSGIKEYTNNITAIVSVTDYGFDSDESRKAMQVLPLEDVKDSIVSLATKKEEMEKLFNYRFQTGKLAGIKFSDIYFSAMNDVTKNFTDSIMKSSNVLNIVGKVLPVTLDEMKIVAELENGYMVEEKARIPEVVFDKITKINRIMLNPSNCRPAPGVVEAIKNADCIIIGPGSLYTNVIPNLLINGVTKAIKESSAIKVYISNIMTEPGQTDNYSVADHLNAIIEHVGSGIIDYCIYDTGEIIPEFIKKYNMEGQDLVYQDIEKVKGIKFLQRNLSMVTGELIRHDPKLVAESIIELICDDLKYQDKQNDPQFLMLNNKLKEEKRINKVKKDMAKKAIKATKKPEKVSNSKSKSKFQSKYSERIASIQEADAKAKEKILKDLAKRREQEQKMQKELEKKKAREEKMQQEMKRKLQLQEKKKQQELKKQEEIKKKEESKISTKPKSARGRKRKVQK